MSDEHMTPEGKEPAPGGQETTAAAESASAAATATEPGPIQADPTTDVVATEAPTPPPIPTPEPIAPIEAQVPPPIPVQTVAVTPASTGNSMDEFEAAVEAFAGGGATDRPTYRRDETLTVTVIHVDKDQVYVDLGMKAEGRIPKEELGVNVENPEDVVKVGDKIKVKVVRTDSKDGNPIVSKRKADMDVVWDRLKEAFEEKKVVTGFVINRVKGGLEVDLGVRGFIPGSHVGNGKVRNLDRFLGQSLNMKIIDIDDSRRKIVLSNRLAEDESREEKKLEIFDRVKPGEVLTGSVRRLVDYGAFIDLGGVDGLLHISEMSWARVDHPREVLKEGDEVKVMVLRLDPDTGRISLGRRQVMPDPWTTIRDNYTVNQKMMATISRVVQSGAFVKLPEGAEAFIPASEMSHRRAGKPSEIVKPGEEIEVQVLELRPDERRMVLSIRALQPYEERAPSMEEFRSERPDQREGRGGGGGGKRDKGRGGRQETGDGGRGATIGERLGALRGFSNHDDDEDLMEDIEIEEQKIESEVVVTAEPEPLQVALEEAVAEAASETPNEEPQA